MKKKRLTETSRNSSGSQPDISETTPAENTEKKDDIGKGNAEDLSVNQNTTGEKKDEIPQKIEAKTIAPIIVDEKKEIITQAPTTNIQGTEKKDETASVTPEKIETKQVVPIPVNEEKTIITENKDNSKTIEIGEDAVFTAIEEEKVADAYPNRKAFTEDQKTEAKTLYGKLIASSSDDDIKTMLQASSNETILRGVMELFVKKIRMAAKEEEKTRLQNIAQKIIDRENEIINARKTAQTEEKKETVNTQKEVVVNDEKKEELKITDYFDPSTDRTNLVLPRLISEKNVSGTQRMNNVNARNRTDEGRNKDSEKFMESRIKEGSIVIDIGSALGNSDPKYAGICVQELYENTAIMKDTGGNIIATDIDGRGNKQVWEKNVAAKKAYGIKTERVSTAEGFQTPVKSIVDKYGTATSPVVIRAANSIDILMSEADAIKHFEHIADTLKGHEVTYMFNKYILYKPADSIKFSVIGTLNEAAFDHQGVKRKTNPDRVPYTLNEKGKKLIQPVTAYTK